MASRNYGLAYDTPYNRALLDTLRKYVMLMNTGEPDHFVGGRSSGLVGGSFIGANGKVTHPHMLQMSDLGSMSGGGRPPGGQYVSPHGQIDRMIDSGTMATYPQFNAVEIKRVNNRTLNGGTFNLGKTLKSVGKVAKSVGKVALPIAQKVALNVAEDAIVGAGVKKRGRPRKVAGVNSTLLASGPTGKGGAFNLGKTLKSVGKVAKSVGKVALPVATKVAGDIAEKAVSSYLAGDGVADVGIIKRGRGRPRKVVEGGNFLSSALKVAKKVGTSAGKPFEKSVGINPFSAGYDLGHDVIAPALMGKGVDGRKVRAEIVKKIMKEKGLKMTDASKYVKEKGLYKK